MTTSPRESLTPPCWRIARMEPTKCWFVPMRPVTPFMMMPMERSFIGGWTKETPESDGWRDGHTWAR